MVINCYEFGAASSHLECGSVVSPRLTLQSGDILSDTMIPLAVPDMRGNEAAYLVRCVEDNWMSSGGPSVIEFERKMADLTGRLHGIAMASGTAALHLALTVAGVRPGDHVIVPDWTFAATANAVYHAGAVPLFVDVTRESWTLDPALTGEAIAKAARTAQRRIAAVVAVHALGHPADLDPLAEICRAAGIPLIEDAAGAIGARYRGRPAGSVGNAAIFSFNGNKTVTAGGGGMIVTDDAVWAERARSLSTQGRISGAYRYDVVGFNYRMPNINAAVGIAQLERLDEMVAAKRRIASIYDRALESRDDLIAMPRCGWADSACWLYALRCPSPNDAADLAATLHDRAIDARVFWESLAHQAPYCGAPRLLSGVSNNLSGHVVTLPCSSSLPPADQKRVCNALAVWAPRRT